MKRKPECWNEFALTHSARLYAILHLDNLALLARAVLGMEMMMDLETTDGMTMHDQLDELRQ